MVLTSGEISSKETENDLARNLFDLEEFEPEKYRLRFSHKLQQLSSHNFHSPLLHFSEFNDHWQGLLPPPETKVVENWRSSLKPVKKDGVLIFPELRGSTSGMFLMIANMENGGNERVNAKVENANSAKLFGVISIPSFFETATWLKTKGFRGKLEAIDISPIPLEIINAYKKRGLLPSQFQIELTQRDVVLPSESEASADLILSDVLGYYLPQHQYEILKKTVGHTLKNGGLWLTRELVEPMGQPLPNSRTVLPTQQTLNERFSKFGSFIKKYMGKEPEYKTIEDFENTRWLHLPTFPRKSNEDYLQPLPTNLAMVDSIGATSPALSPENQPPRIFHTSVIEKNLF